MADISKISPDGGTTEYNIKDATARSSVTTIDGKIPSSASSSNKLATASDVNDLWSANAVLGAVNRCFVKLSDVKSNNTSGTWTGNAYELNGITFTFHEKNGYVSTVDASGTSSAGSTTVAMPVLNGMSGNYKQNGGIANNINITSKKNNSWTNLYSKGKTDAYDISFVATDTYTIYLNINNDNVSVSGTFYPMLYPDGVDGSVYAPPAMTNGELTAKVQGIIDAANNAADFAAFKTAIGNL